MYEMRDEIQNRFQKEIVWERLDLKKASRIKHEIAYRDLFPEYVNFYDQDAIDKWIEWYADHMKLFYQAVLPTWNKVGIVSTESEYQLELKLIEQPQRVGLWLC